MVGEVTSIADCSAKRVTAFSSCTGMLFLRAKYVTARYSTPVSKYRYPKSSASLFASVDFPDAAGPSMAITFGMLTSQLGILDLPPICEGIIKYPERSRLSFGYLRSSSKGISTTAGGEDVSGAVMEPPTNRSPRTQRITDDKIAGYLR